MINTYLSFHTLRAGDRAKIRDISETGDYDIYDTKYGNTYAWVTLKVFLQTKSIFTDIDYQPEILIMTDPAVSKNMTIVTRASSRLSDQRDYSVFGLKQDWNWQPSNNLLLRGLALKSDSLLQTISTEIQSMKSELILKEVAL